MNLQSVKIRALLLLPPLLVIVVCMIIFTINIYYKIDVNIIKNMAICYTIVSMLLLISASFIMYSDFHKTNY